MPQIVFIKNDFIKLGQILKLTHIITNGGQAAGFLSSNLVLVNGEPETRRGRKICLGDVVKINQTELHIQTKG